MKRRLESPAFMKEARNGLTQRRVGDMIKMGNRLPDAGDRRTAVDLSDFINEHYA